MNNVQRLKQVFRVKTSAYILFMLLFNVAVVGIGATYLLSYVLPFPAKMMGFFVLLNLVFGIATINHMNGDEKK